MTTLRYKTYTLDSDNGLLFGAAQGAIEREGILNAMKGAPGPLAVIVDFSQIQAFDIAFFDEAITTIMCRLAAEELPNRYLILRGVRENHKTAKASLSLRNKCVPALVGGELLALGNCFKKDRFALRALNLMVTTRAREFLEFVQNNTSFSFKQINEVSTSLYRLHSNGLCWRYFDPRLYMRGGGRQYRYCSLLQPDFPHLSQSNQNEKPSREGVMV